ncbi:hypothetical protein BTVI_95213 [Pitangus sulphuratus]|nr:hypothetical protein BTVI_95213 [Pitangus sulphuratus]
METLHSRSDLLYCTCRVLCTDLERHTEIYNATCHQKYRAILKKEKRKKKRQALAKLRDSEATEKDESVSEEEEEEVEKEEEEEEEKKLEAERQKLHEQWLLREEKAQEEFKLKKEKEEAARKRQEEEEVMYKLTVTVVPGNKRKIKEEWEEQQRKEREVAQQKQQEKKERELENGVSWHNPEPPENLGTEKDRANCPFYIKTGSCRFGDRCSRKHNYPTSSKTLLIRGMFITFGMEQCRRDDYDTDASLEYSDEETYQQFLEFYEDVLPEFQNVGKVVQFKPVQEKGQPEPRSLLPEKWRIREKKESPQKQEAAPIGAVEEPGEEEVSQQGQEEERPQSQQKSQSNSQSQQKPEFFSIQEQG